MGLPAPSQADPSRGFRPVEAARATVDERVAPVLGVATPPLDEDVSPELALVDPELAARLRARLPEIELEPPEPVVPTEEATVHPLRPALSVLDGHLGSEVEDGVVLAGSHASGVPPPDDRSEVKRLVTAFLAGAAAAAVVTTGVIAEMSETDTFGGEPETVPPVTAPVATANGASQAAKPAAKTQAPGSAASQTAKKSQTTATPKTGVSGKQATTAGAKRRAENRAKRQAAAAQAKAQAAKSAQATGKTAAKQKQAQEPTQRAGAQTSPKTSKKPAVAALEPRRFAWAPVDGAAGYRVEIFRGDKQILQVTTKTPSYSVPATWRHRGQAESLAAGTYRWYVWPLLPDGPAPKASVQAQLEIP